ncbi:DUF3027 domain-containing protein [Rathayibacter sp. VKM Ac-2754]|uniref:DUF3027 domain-containing protein n=1 Tax=Rathayibacter sp. VKM Ac-2754 TaxID=2609251 RepID=UPI0013589C8A|nr:DUF3027 domain-containing protein [Rathayibacter sp. VKM Ac-2754]MWV57225.1 DUF3027 domain-containing protein [Rathayibacter sp. VKM Ac-2754]
MPDADETTDESVAWSDDQTLTFSGDGQGAVRGSAPAETPDASTAPDAEPALADDAAEQVASAPAEPERVYEADPVLAASEERARAALAEITPPETIGALVATLAQGEHVISLQFANLMRGYPGWLWTATLSRIDESEDVNVLEVELLPGEGAVLAPDWVPWSVRLADYHAAQDSVEGDDAFDGSDDDDEMDDEESDESDDGDELVDDEFDETAVLDADAEQDDSDDDDSDDDDDEDDDDDDEDDLDRL